MSNLFANMTSEGLEESQDRIGGFNIFDSGIYHGTIDHAYAGSSASSDAQFVEFQFNLGGQTYKERIFITDGEGKHWYITKDNNKAGLPGYNTVNDICQLATGKPLNEQPSEKKTLMLWDTESRSETPQNVPVLVNLVGKPIALAIIKELKNKQAKNETTGKWENTPESREENRIEKVFHSEQKVTAGEVRKAEGDKTPLEPVFYDKWLTANKGKIKDRRKIKEDTGGTLGSPTTGTVKPLFGNN